MKDQILLHKTENKVFVIKNLFSELHSWDDFFSHLNEMINKNNEGLGNKYAEELGGKVKGGVNFWQPLTMTVDGVTNKHFSKLDLYLDKLKSLHPHGYYGCFAVIGLNITEGTPMHNDPVDVFYVQQIGKVVWEITQDDIKTEYMLEPGDAIFVPAHILHEVKSLTPRAALSFMFYRDERNQYN